MLIDGASKQGFSHRAEAPSRPRFPATLANSGLLILSRYPVISTHTKFFRRQAWYDLFAVNRGVMHAEIRVGQTKVNFFTTHLSPGLETCAHLLNIDVDHDSKWVDNRDAQHQAKEVQEYMRERASDGFIVLAGDFNCRGGSSLYHMCCGLMGELELGVRDVTVREGSNGVLSWLPTFGCVHPDGTPTETLFTPPGEQGKPKTLDYIFSNLQRIGEAETVSFSAKGMPFQQVSDHHGVLVSLLVP
mmetsp:Transcript_20354/g.44077  ORF Transcript_20354/g.44077 Transcript_20354/m.44077 type:complete len:245 (-) Transcript_20354:50-784(-)